MRIGFAGLGACVNGIDDVSGDPCAGVVSAPPAASSTVINVTGLTADQIAALATGIVNPVFTGTYSTPPSVTSQLTSALSQNSTWIVAGCAVLGLFIAMRKR